MIGSGTLDYPGVVSRSSGLITPVHREYLRLLMLLSLFQVARMLLQPSVRSVYDSLRASPLH